MPKKQKKNIQATPKKKAIKFCWFKPQTWQLAPLATLGPIGYFPKGSGTIGSLVALPIAYCASNISIYLLWGITVLFFVFGLRAIAQFTENTTEKDPNCVIVDEVVGQLMTFLVVMPHFMHWPVLLIGFILFRFFDIFKFGLVAFWDRRKKPLGVMMDDVAAGIFAGFILAILQVLSTNNILD